MLSYPNSCLVCYPWFTLSGISLGCCLSANMTGEKSSSEHLVREQIVLYLMSIISSKIYFSNVMFVTENISIFIFCNSERLFFWSNLWHGRSCSHVKLVFWVGNSFTVCHRNNYGQMIFLTPPKMFYWSWIQVLWALFVSSEYVWIHSIIFCYILLHPVTHNCTLLTPHGPQ